MTESLDELRARLNVQTGKLSWPEIQRHFARGVVLVVAQQADLLEIAAAIINDDQAAVGDVMENGALSRASLEDARSWQEKDPLFWAIVAAPWVLVQEVGEERSAK